MRTIIELLVQLKSMNSIIDATQRDQRQAAARAKISEAANASFDFLVILQSPLFLLNGLTS